MERAHQCATIQLDFQLPIRFRLKYQCKTQAAPGAEGESAAPAEGAKAVMEQEADEPAGAEEGEDKRKWGLTMIMDASEANATCCVAFLYLSHTYISIYPTTRTIKNQIWQRTTWTQATSGPSSCTAPCWAPSSA